jgi:hypothetical protein
MALTCGSPVSGPRLAGGAGLLLLLLRLVVGMPLEGLAAEDLKRLVADELSLAVVVCRDDHLGGALGRFAQRRKCRRRPPVDHPGKVRRLDHVAEVLETPPPVRVGEHGLHDVTAQTDGHGILVVVDELVGLDLLPAAAVLGDRHFAAENIGDLASGGILLCDDEPHGPTSTGHGRVVPDDGS